MGIGINRKVKTSLQAMIALGILSSSASSPTPAEIARAKTYVPKGSGKKHERKAKSKISNASKKRNRK